jgi:amino acid transporter
MSEKFPGAELPAGGTPATSADGVRMQILATEHWSLLANRSLGYTDSFSRASMFFSVLSGTVIALALIAQAGRTDSTFFAAALLLLPVVFFVGIVTITRIGNLSAEDARWVMGMNRIRHAYMEMHPELRQYFITSEHDDVRGVLTTFGISAPTPGANFLSDVGHGMQTLPGMLGTVTAVVAGAWAALVGVALGADQAVAIAIGTLIFILTIVALGFFARRAVLRTAGGHVAKFPSPVEKKT